MSYFASSCCMLILSSSLSLLFLLSLDFNDHCFILEMPRRGSLYCHSNDDNIAHKNKNNNDIMTYCNNDNSSNDNNSSNNNNNDNDKW